MRSRRSAITLLVVMIIVVGALSAAERDRTRDRATTTTTTTAAQAQPAETTGDQVVATLPRDSPVRAKVGDSVVLRVRSETPDIAQMLQLGLSTSVGPELLGELQFVADAPGTFPVTLEVAGTVGGLVEVR